ncbi:hypothetical protein ES708_33270 [subsurface metagenome]
MATGTAKRPPWWFLFTLGILAVAAACLYLYGGITAGFTTGRIVRIVAYALLGIIMLWMGREYRKEAK